MKKFNVLFATTLLALGLVFVTPTAMADESGNGKGVIALVFCKALKEVGLLETFGYKNLGQCVKYEIQN